jgi:hypothetical protein
LIRQRHQRILSRSTCDERHFRALRGLDGEPFEILPSDG